MKTELVNYLKAAFPCVAIQTTDEARATAEVLAAAKEVGQRKVYTWSVTEGLCEVREGARPESDTEDLQAACRKGMKLKDAVVILRDPQTFPFANDPALLRSFRDFLHAGPEAGRTAVVIAPEFRPHQCVEKMVVIIEQSLPDAEGLKTIAKNIAASFNKPDVVADEAVLRALGGLTVPEAENALCLSMIETDKAEGGPKFDPVIIYREKVKTVRKSGLLDIVDPDPRGMDAIGGLDQLKSWIGERVDNWSPDAAAFGVDNPKGVLMVGVPGTGKSLCAKAVGTALGVPTLKLDIGELFNSLVGESEARTRAALKLAEALAPCVLWVDEIDKGLAGTTGIGGGDGGVTMRVFGTIITWMQERKRPVFMVATANDVTTLPSALLRKGRWDELFAIDLPTEAERKEIVSIHLRNKKRDPANFDLGAIAHATEAFTGSELEAVVSAAIVRAYAARRTGDDKKRDVTTDDLVFVAGKTVPLAITAKESIDAIRNWGETRATFASTKQGVQAPAPSIGRRVTGKN